MVRGWEVFDALALTLERDTFRAMAVALGKAKETIFITDWFLIPEIFLIRDKGEDLPELLEENRLDKILLKKAKVTFPLALLTWLRKVFAFTFCCVGVVPVGLTFLQGMRRKRST